MGLFNVRSGKRRKITLAEGIEKVAHEVKEDKASNAHVRTTVCHVAESMNIQLSTVQYIMRIVLYYYLYNFQLVQKLFSNDFDTQLWFSQQCLPHLNSGWP